MARFADIKWRPLPPGLTAETATAGRCAHTREGDEALPWDQESELAGLAQYLRESMLVRSAPWPTSPR